jgi:hypothetical protein
VTAKKIRGVRLSPYEADRVPQVLAFEAWSERQKRVLGPFAGLKVFSRTSGGSLIIVSRHWPHLLCWQWLLDWVPYRTDERRRWFALYRQPNSWTLHLARLGYLYFKRQSYDRMAALGPRWADAPVIFPPEGASQ